LWYIWFRFLARDLQGTSPLEIFSLQPPSLEGKFNSPTGIAIDDTGDVYVCDKVNNRVQVFGINVP